MPDLFKHMDAQGFSIPMFGIEWFTTLVRGQNSLDTLMVLAHTDATVSRYSSQFSLSTKLDLACAVFDLFFVGVPDIFLRTGLAILKVRVLWHRHECGGQRLLTSVAHDAGCSCWRRS
jgi:hypothetical protein